MAAAKNTVVAAMKITSSMICFLLALLVVQSRTARDPRTLLTSAQQTA